MRTLPTLLAVALAPHLLPAQAPPPDLQALITRHAAPLVDAELAVGLVVGVIDGEREQILGFGAVAPGGALPAADTLYEIGSNSKVFTGLLLADAVQRGVVTLEDPVQTLLPEGVMLPSWETTPIRLWHLSAHVSGLPRLPNLAGGNPKDPYAHFTPARLLAELPKLKVRHEPGSEYEYSNLAVGLLGQLLASKQGFADYAALLRERITTPLGLRDTVLTVDDARQARFAPPFSALGEPDHTWDLAALAGAGGIRSTAQDMLRFARLQLQPAGPLAEAVRLSQQRRHEGQKGIAVALGWHLARDGQSLVHSGQTGGYHSFFGVVPSTGRAVVVLANTARGEFDAVGEKLLQALHGKDPSPLQVERPVAVPREALQRLVGRYRLDAGHTFHVVLQPRGLYAQLTGQDAFRLFPRSPTEFFYRAVAASITFELDGESVRALVLHQNGKDLRCERLPQ